MRHSRVSCSFVDFPDPLKPRPSFTCNTASYLVSKIPPNHLEAMKVVIKQWTAVAAWRWDMPEDDVCGICRNPYDSTCSQCRYPGEECPLREFSITHRCNIVQLSNISVVMGECNHSFHMHCIIAWVRQESSQERCPMCRKRSSPKQIKNTSAKSSHYSLERKGRCRSYCSRYHNCGSLNL